jgi:hypothetical protein
MEDDDDFDLDFNFDDLSQEEQYEIEKEQKEKSKRVRTSPVFKKAVEVLKTTTALVESLSEKDKEFYASILIESAYMLAPKVAGAMGCESWVLCMQNASIIRYHAEYLLTSTSGLRIFTKAEKDYVQILRTEVEEFRELFKEWVKEFNNLEDEDYEDEWGLFIRK